MKNAEKVVKNLITGMLGVGLYMAASWLLFAYGEGNSHNGLIESNWAKMPIIRFRLAILITALAAPLFLIGVQGAVRAINTARRKRYPVDFYMAKLFVMGAYASAISMLFNMAVSVMLPVLYRELFNTRLMGAEIISTVERISLALSICGHLPRSCAWRRRSLRAGCGSPCRSFCRNPQGVRLFP